MIESRVEAMHRECGIRTVMGSMAHLEKRCSCYVPGSIEGDDPGLTKREAARQAAAMFDQQTIRFRRAHFPDPQCPQSSAE
jgi:hypothetical protein